MHIVTDAGCCQPQPVQRFVGGWIDIKQDFYNFFSCVYETQKYRIIGWVKDEKSMQGFKSLSVRKSTLLQLSEMPVHDMQSW